MLDIIPAPLIVIFGGIAILALIALRDYFRDKRRLEDLMAWAAGLGYTVEPGVQSLQDAGLGPDLLTLPLFRRGRAQKVVNLVRAATGHDGMTLVFEHRHTTGSGKNATLCAQTVVAFEVPGAEVPTFELRPEGVFSKLGQAFGDPDIDFDSSPEFSRKYQLRGQDADAVRRLFETVAVPFLAQSDSWSVDGGGNWIVVFTHNRRQQPEHLDEFIAQARSVLRALVAR